MRTGACGTTFALACLIAAACGGGGGGSSSNGGGTTTGTGSAVAGRDWTLATPTGAAFGRRYWPGGNGAVVFNGAMWVLGSSSTSDVWKSTDGATWTQTTASGGFVNGYYNTTGVVGSPYPYELGFTVFNNRLWAIAGTTTWSSSDGATWTQGPGPAGLEFNYVLAFNGELWVIGPWGSSGDRVYHSADGTTWQLATAAAPWGTERLGASVAVFGGKMWVIGGTSSRGTTADVWSSSDGVTWTAATLNAGFSPRFGHATVVYGNQLWVIGGAHEVVPTGSAYPTATTAASDVWASPDGVSWTQVATSAAWAARFQASAVAYNGALWLIGGAGSGPTSAPYPLFDGVWRSP